MLCVGGGTLGSVSPLLAMIEAMRTRHPEMGAVFVGSRHGPERTMAEHIGIRSVAMTAGKFRRYFSWRTLLTPIEILIGFFQALLILAWSRPAIVIGSGSYVSVPMIWAAVLCRIPVYVHQQDIRVGLAIRLTAPFARRISVVFPESTAVHPTSKVVYTGNPVRRGLGAGNKQRAAQRYQLDPALKTVLVLGGSTGAAGLNALIRSVIQRGIPKTQWIHMTGGRGAQRQPSHRATYHTEDFLSVEAMADAYAVADIVISRAGLSTISELAALAKPVILVPLPGTHQQENAMYVAERGAGHIVHERDGAATLQQAIEKLLNEDQERKRLSMKIQQLNPHDAAERAVRIIEEIVYG